MTTKPKRKPAKKTTVPSTVPAWMEPVLKTAKKTKKRKTKIQKEVEQVYKDVLLPNRDEREPELVADGDEEIVLNTELPEEPIIHNESEPVVELKTEPVEVKVDVAIDNQQLRELIKEKVFKSFSAREEKIKSLKPEIEEVVSSGHRPLRRPDNDCGLPNVFTQVQNSLKKLVEHYLQEGRFDEVIKYAGWIKEIRADAILVPKTKPLPTVKSKPVAKYPRVAIKDRHEDIILGGGATGFFNDMGEIIFDGKNDVTIDD